MTKRSKMSGEEFRTLRDVLGMTQEQLGTRMGVDGRTIRKWENNERNIPGPAIELAKILVELKSKT
ncbi:MAG: helix-turn-helix domain-containing protein [Rhodomicrobium sp.]